MPNKNPLPVRLSAIVPKKTVRKRTIDVRYVTYGGMVKKVFGRQYYFFRFRSKLSISPLGNAYAQPITTNETKQKNHVNHLITKIKIQTFFPLGE